MAGRGHASGRDGHLALAGTARWHGLWWVVFTAVLLAAPLLFERSASISLLSQIATAMLLALSYNLLLGQGGMLSFGHAIYAGVGGYATIHLLHGLAGNAAAAPPGALLPLLPWLPPLPLAVAWLPLAGGCAAAAVALLFGYVASRGSGMVFSMITLGIAELAAAAVPLFPGWFGGEGGLSGNRVVGTPLWGIDFGPPLQLYYLIAAWLLAGALAMYRLTLTPAGRLLNAVRDNPARVASIGYDPRRIRYLAQIAAAFFAGIAGALVALDLEIASPESIGALQSANILLFTYLGGIAYFYGPMLGALAGVLCSVVLARHTSAWQLYLGLAFMVLVWRAPGGLAGLPGLLWRRGTALSDRRKTPDRQTGAAPVAIVSSGGSRLARHCVIAALKLIAAAAVLCGGVLLIELANRRAAGSAYDTTLLLFGMALDSGDANWWQLAVVLLCGGTAVLWRGRRLPLRRTAPYDVAAARAVRVRVAHDEGQQEETQQEDAMATIADNAETDAMAGVAAGMNTGADVDIALASPALSALPALRLSALGKRYGGTVIIDGCDLTVTAGRRYALIGPNGAGKSTLLDLISGRQHCDSGSIRLFGADLRGMSAHRVCRQGLARSFQTSSLFANLSVIDHLRIASLRVGGEGYWRTWWRRLDRPAATDDHVMRMLSQLGLETHAHAPAGTLTYAAQRILELGMAIAGGADVLLLDEPTAGLNRTEAAAMVALIRRVTHGKTLLLVEHDMQVVFDLADTVAVMAEGRIVACDTPERIRDNPLVRRHYPGLPISRTMHDLAGSTDSAH